MAYVCMVIAYSRVWINQVRLPPCPCSRLRIWSRETGSAVPFRVSQLILHTQAESGASSWDSSRFLWWHPFIRLKPPYAIGSVPSLAGHAIAYRWRSLPRVCWYRASSPQGSSSNGCCLCTTAPLFSHNHYWFKAGIFKVPEVYYY